LFVDFVDTDDEAWRPGRTAGDGPDGRDGRDGGRAQPSGDAAGQVTALYRAHSLGLARLALVMLGDAAAAEDIVQDAFLGLYRNWGRLADRGAALGYLRASVLNGCRTALRRGARRDIPAGRMASEFPDKRNGPWLRHHRPGSAELPGGIEGAVPPLDSAEAAVLLGEEHRAVLAAIRRLPGRQRESLVLRYYLDLTEEQAAAVMKVTKGTVKSATSRALAALGRMLKEDS
jgi:RNA polymerase sigma factor (sigma-70 family)